MSCLRSALVRISLKVNIIPIALLLITVLGGFLRFYNLNWDSGLSFHPDERNIAASVSRIKLFDQLNPQFFAYGGFLIYTYRAAGELLLQIRDDPSWILSWGKINLIGRFFSAVFATLNIAAIYFLTKKLLNKKNVALLASFVAAFSPSLIQTAHYSITESFLALLAVLLCFCSLYLIESSKLKFYILCGIIYGVAVATKISAFSFIVFPAVAHLIVLFKKPKGIQLFVKRNLLFIVLLAISGFVFVIFSSYIFWNWEKFMESMQYEFGVATGSFSVPYTLQFTGTVPYLFQIKNLVYQLGPLVLFSFVGLIWMLFILIRKINLKIGVFLSFIIVYFLYVGTWFTKFIRFMVPALPFLVIAGCFCLFLIRAKNKLLGNLLIALVAVTTVFWGLAFFSIYTREQTRISASKWIYKNISSGSKILGEHWDDGLPVHLNGFTPRSLNYDIEQLTIYEPDNDEKALYYARKLNSADYVVLNSRRLYGTLIHLEDKYPLTSRYYKLLFAGVLGYEKVAEFASYPSLLGIVINDDDSEETFQVYDHPKVIIFAKTTPMSQARLVELLRGNKLPAIQ